jgi:hypothetical protein
MPDEDLYGDGNPPADAASGPRPEAEDRQPDRESEEDEGTALLPKGFFGPEVQPGERYEVEVVRIHDEEIECRRVEKDEGEPHGPGDEGEQPGAAAPAPTDSMYE